MLPKWELKLLAYSALCAFTVANGGAFFLLLTQYDASVHAENALLENIQASSLGFAAFAYLVLRPTSAGERVVYLGLALLSFSFMLRELDLDRMNVSLFLQTLGSGSGRVLLLSALWTSLGVYAWKSIPAKLQFVRMCLTSQVFVVLSMTFCLLVFGAMMDKKIFSLAEARLLEELFETNAYFLLLMPVLFSPLRAIGRLDSMPRDAAVGADSARRDTVAAGTLGH